MALAASDGVPDAVHQVEVVEGGGRHRNGPVDASAALLEGAEHDAPAREVHALGAHLKELAFPAAGVQHGAQGPHLRAALRAAAMNAARSSAVR